VLDTEKNEDELVLIGRRQLRSNNSWLHNSKRLMGGKNRCTLLMHPDDASQRNMDDGDTVVVQSRVGSLEIPLEKTEAMMPGVVSIPHGFGHGKKGSNLDVANKNAGVSINDLTDEEHFDSLTGNAGFSGVPVEVKPVGV
jgi:anaerobic selenocysteine-containing dehydrogenase